jgi:hypothetical protein
MDSLLIFYFFILLTFLKSINIDYRLIIFVIILGIFYNYHYSKKENIDEKLKDSIKQSKVYSYGNIINKFDDLDEKNIREIRDVKSIIYSMDIYKNDKIEIYSAIKKYFHVYNNYDKYDYKHNWINDLYDFETTIYNKISSLNISYENMEDEINILYNEVKDVLNEIKSNLKNSHVYNNIDHPIGYDKNKTKSYLF